MTIDEIYKNEEISVRSYNVCRYNGLDSIDKLIEYYLKNSSFENLRNCGRRSNEELIEICKKYHSTNADITTEQTVKNPLEEILANLTRIQREVINSFILVNSISLSTRSKNAISQFLGGNFSVRNFAEKILLDKKFNVATIENVGKKSIPELEVYISIVRDFIKNVNEANDEKQLITLKNNFLIQRTFSISRIPSEILQSESIFQLTDFLLKNNALFNENHNLIIQKALKIYQNDKEQTLDEIASENNLSRERVRQIRKDCINELFEKLSFIKNFNDDLFKNYGIDLSSDFIEVEENLVHKINELNKTNFSKEFTSYILAVYLSDNFVLIGNIEDILLPKFSLSRDRHNWKNFYIANKELNKLDFESFANDINNRLKERIEETYSFNFKSYLSKFVNDIDIEIIEKVFPVAEKIINDEFNLLLDLNDNIIFERNTLKQVSEYAFEALEILGKPSNLSEIFKVINEKMPGVTKSEEALRGSIQRNPEIIYFGRSSTYGLKKWENETENIKGGTIRSIVIEYLEMFDSPKHITQITEYVSNFRERTYQRSIMDNLKADKSNVFIFLRQGFIGLNYFKEKYDTNKYQNLPIQLGKTLIALSKKEYSKQDIVNYIKSNYNLNEEESIAIINNLEI